MTDRKESPFFVYTLAAPYFEGARAQLGRYRQAVIHLKQSPIYICQVCVYEVSSLFEHLATLAKYAEMVGDTHPHHNLWVDVRNHIRHDTRENIDTDSRRKAERVQRLGVSPIHQFHISFDPSYIKVGGINVPVEEIESYLVWAGEVIGRVLYQAVLNGLINGAGSAEIEYWQRGMR